MAQLGPSLFFFSDTGCECINDLTHPSLQTIVNDPDIAHHADPNISCKKEAIKNVKFCYVEKNSLCEDVKGAKGRGRYYSEVACDNFLKN